MGCFSAHGASAGMEEVEEVCAVKSSSLWVSLGAGISSFTDLQALRWVIWDITVL